MSQATDAQHSTSKTTRESVLTSLSELRSIEQERERQESARRAEVAAKALAAQEVAREAAEAEKEAAAREAKRQAELVQKRRRHEEREERLRIEEAERRARVQAEVRRSEQRLVLETEHRTRHRPLIIIASLVALFAVGGAGLLLLGLGAEEREGQKANNFLGELTRQHARLRGQRRRLLELQRTINAHQRNLDETYRKNAAAAARAVALARLKAKDRKRPSRSGSRHHGRKKPPKIILNPRCSDPSDPICGLKRGRGY